LRQLDAGVSVFDMLICFILWCENIARNATAAQLESANRAVEDPYPH
jgi:hypothetical protein